MSIVLQLVRPLPEKPPIVPASGISVRTFSPADVAGWLDLRRRAFAREKVGVREWTAADFEAEFMHKPWWNPAHLWLAEDDCLPLAERAAAAPLVGAVCLALRGAGADAKAVVHWLMVAPRYRRRGIARTLVGTLEAAAYEAGFRHVYLETHAGWEAAGRLYEKLGYREVR